MLNPQDRSKAFNFALKAQEIFGFIIGLSIVWSIYALVFTQIETLYISKVLLSLICISCDKSTLDGTCKISSSLAGKCNDLYCSIINIITLDFLLYVKSPDSYSFKLLMDIFFLRHCIWNKTF